MSLEGLLIHTLQVYRRSGRRDRFGQQVDINPRQGGDIEPTVSYDCRAYMKTGGLLMEERMVDTFQRIFEVFVDFGADIREDDTVSCFDPSTGHHIFGKAKVKDSEVKYDSEGPHHIELTVWEQAGPGSTN